MFLAIAISLTLAHTQPAAAQTSDAQVERELDRVFDTPISPAEFDAMTRVLRLDDDQLAAVRTLHDSTIKAHQRALGDLRSRTTQTDDLTESQFEDLMSDSLAASRTRLEFARAFLNDVRALLNDDQLVLWERVEYARRRAVYLRYGLLPAESVDLVAIIEALALSREQLDALDDPLARYEYELDLAIETRAMAMRARADYIERIQALIRNGNAEAAQQMSDGIWRGIEIGARRIVRMNRRHARLLEPLLPEPTRELFTSEFNKLSFPSIYLRLPASFGVLDRIATQDQEFTPEQADALAAIQSWHNRRMTELHRQMEQILETEAHKALKGTSILDPVMSDMSNRERVRELMDDREGISEETLARLEKLLGDKLEQLRPQERSVNQLAPTPKLTRLAGSRDTARLYAARTLGTSATSPGRIKIGPAPEACNSTSPERHAKPTPSLVRPSQRHLASLGQLVRPDIKVSRSRKDTRPDPPSLDGLAQEPDRSAHTRPPDRCATRAGCPHRVDSSQTIETSYRWGSGPPTRLHPRQAHARSRWAAGGTRRESREPAQAVPTGSRRRLQHCDRSDRSPDPRQRASRIPVVHV